MESSAVAIAGLCASAPPCSRSPRSIERAAGCRATYASGSGTRSFMAAGISLLAGGADLVESLAGGTLAVESDAGSGRLIWKLDRSNFEVSKAALAEVNGLAADDDCPSPALYAPSSSPSSPSPSH